MSIKIKYIPEAMDTWVEAKIVSVVCHPLRNINLTSNPSWLRSYDATRVTIDAIHDPIITALKGSLINEKT